ncbi:AI-2E family transporter [Herbaspirillum rhizosphaerae]|uniref:AI-2E family transporter n=1 Tax=Herbaspirillum rhizosphaerae TaxID=346179 RepID=UPI00067B2339|nr:AI-2E family transporter [Herbaspirillum rhizosphaerae]
MSSQPEPRRQTNQVAGILGTATVLALLYFGRDVLIPITLAIILSLLITPFIHRLRRIGLGQTLSVGVAVVTLALSLAAVGLVIGVQVVRIGGSLPQYADTIRSKVNVLDQLTLGKLGELNGQAGRWIDHLSDEKDAKATASVGAAPALRAGSNVPIPVEIHAPPQKPLQLLTRIASSVWAPLETAGIVFVVLIFVLLEHEALRDRFIRLAGGNDLRATTIAVNDAGERLSRFFVSQFAVNIGVGVLVWLGLSILGLSQALLWGAMAAILRFIPYVGVWIAAFCATLLAAAISPGWSLAVMTLMLFLVIEVVFAQLVEPKLYGHTTGLSPLSVVIAAIFWSWIWGPVGLVLSTPLTLCLVVAGRYFRALNMFEILLGEIPALTLPQNFYQRALSGDTQEIIASARQILKRKSFAAYCDSVLVPALHLARADLDANAISKGEQLKVGTAIASVIEALGENPKWWRQYTRISMLEDVNIGRQLRRRREAVIGGTQGSFDVPAGTIVLGIGAGSGGDELAAEILVRILRKQNVDGRHVTLGEMGDAPPPDVKPGIVAMFCLVSIEPVKEQAQIEAALMQMTQRLPHVKQLVLQIASPFEQLQLQDNAIDGAHEVVHSFEEAVQSCLRNLHVYDKPGLISKI